MIIYDSTSPYDIPTAADAVAGYVDGTFVWDLAGWARFPSQSKIGISVNALNVIGDALDVETGDATPAQAPTWVKARLAQGAKQPWVYCNRSNRSAVEAGLIAAGITANEVALWVATLDGTTSVPNGPYPVAAVQYANSNLSGGHFDLSLTTAYGDSSHTITGEEMTQAQFDTLLQSNAEFQGIITVLNRLYYALGLDSPADVTTTKSAVLTALQSPSPSAPKSVTFSGTGSIS